MIMRHTSAGFLAIVAVMAGLGHAAGQAQPGRPGAKPQVFGDWAMTCVTRPNLPPCEIFQTVVNKEKNSPIARTSFSYSPQGDQFAGQVQLPLGTLLTSGILIRLDDKTDIKTFVFTRCEKDGCFAERLGKAADFEPFRKAQKGVIGSLGRDGKTVAYPLSFKGFPDAWNAMVARNRAASPAAPARPATTAPARPAQ